MMKAIPIAIAVALFTAILAPSSSRAGVSFQFGYGGGSYGSHEYGYPYYRYRRFGYRNFRYWRYGYPTYEHDAPVYFSPPAAAAPSQRAPAPGQPAPYCREYTREIVIDGATQTAYGTACMQADGRWRLVN